jgi:Ca2+:H+ antiporter
MSETLVSTVEGAAKQFGLGEAFIGIILIPILGNVAEHAAAVIMAYKGKINISIEVAIGSSMQIALFVTPLMVIWTLDAPARTMGGDIPLIFGFTVTFPCG